MNVWFFFLNKLKKNLPVCEKENCNICDITPFYLKEYEKDVRHLLESFEDKKDLSTFLIFVSFVLRKKTNWRRAP